MPKTRKGAKPGGHPVQRFYPRRIQELEQQLEAKRHECEALSCLNTTLRSKERVLLETIVTLSPNAHYSALAALEVAHDDDTEAQLAEAVGQDLQIYDLLHQIQNTVAAEDTYTSRCLRAAATPERIKATRTASFKEQMQTLSNLAMRISFLLQQQQQQQQRVQQCKAVKFAMSIEEAIDRYTENVLLYSMVSFKMTQRFCLYNMDTMEEERLPPNHWQEVMEAMQLRRDQMELISALYARYIAKIRPMWEQTQQLAANVRAMLAAADENSCSSGGQDPATAAAAWPQPAEPGQSINIILAAHSSSSICNVGSSGTAVNTSGTDNQYHSRSRKHWQEFGLATLGLDFEAAEKLQGLLLEMDACFNAMSQQSHALTFPAWNTFDRLQLARMVVAAYPWMPNICQICERVWWVVDPEAPRPAEKM